MHPHSFVSLFATQSLEVSVFVDKTGGEDGEERIWPQLPFLGGHILPAPRELMDVCPQRPSSPLHLKDDGAAGMPSHTVCQEKPLCASEAALQLILMVPEKMLCKGSSAVPRGICIIKYLSCLDFNSFRFLHYTVSRMKATLKREMLSTTLKFILIRAVTAGQEDYLCFFT